MSFVMQGIALAVFVGGYLIEVWVPNETDEEFKKRKKIEKEDLMSR